jgi:threonine aldolase
VFVHTTEEILAALRERGWKFYNFIGGAARFMFSWDSKLERIGEMRLRTRHVSVCGNRRN